MEEQGRHMKEQAHEGAAVRIDKGTELFLNVNHVSLLAYSSIPILPSSILP